MDQTAMEHLRGETGTDILIIEGPPRHGKTEYFGKWLPAWHQCRYPDRSTALISYGAAIAKTAGRRARQIVRDHGAEWWDVGLNPAVRSTTEWQTSHGGFMRTAGVGGPITGFGFHLIVVDDFLKNAERALSEGHRDAMWEWWQSTVINRLEPGGKIIIMATRWHDADLIGRLIKQAQDKGEPVAVLRMPAIAEPDDQLGRAVGDALWPERWPREALLKIERKVERFWWLAQYQQRPSRHTSTEWPDEYFEDILTDEWPADQFELGANGIDPSKGRKTSGKPGDYFANVYGGLLRGTIYVDAILDRNRDASNICGHTVEWAYDGDHPTDGVGLEANAFQDLLAPEFDRQCDERELPPLPIHLIHNHADKELRISRWGPYLKRKKIKIRNTPGGRMLLEQLKDFPMGDHDDGPDAGEIMLRILRHVGQIEPDSETSDIDFAEI